MASGYVENTALAILTTSVASRCDDLKLARERMEGDIDSANAKVDEALAVGAALRLEAAAAKQEAAAAEQEAAAAAELERAAQAKALSAKQKRQLRSV